MRNFTSIKQLTATQIHDLLNEADQWLNSDSTLLTTHSNLLNHKTIVNLFFENSTRTRCSFELAARRLGAILLNFDAHTSSAKKGETLFDTVDYLHAMGVDLFIIRHSQEHCPTKLAEHLGFRAQVINAGDGCNEHPTQAMLDMLTIRRHKSDFSQLRVAIIGDIVHSRVATSDIQALITLGVNDIRLVAPSTFLPNTPCQPQLSVHQELSSGIQEVDVIIVLRIQRERMAETAMPNADDYFRHYGLTEKKLKIAKPDVIIMHPGPMNRGIEIASEVVDGPHSVVFEQAKLGVVIRMVLIKRLLDSSTNHKI